MNYKADIEKINPKEKIRITYMNVLQPLNIQWQEIKENDEVSDNENLFLIDYLNENVYYLNGEKVVGDLADYIVDIVKGKKDDIINENKSQEFVSEAEKVYKSLMKENIYGRKPNKY